MTKEKNDKWNKTLEESDALIRRGQNCLKNLTGKLLSNSAFITPSDGDGSEKKMSKISS